MTNLVPAALPVSPDPEIAGVLGAEAPAPSETVTITLHLKVRPEANAWLDQAAREVNQVWNFGNATRAQAARPFVGAPRYLTGYDLDKLTTGCGETFERIGSDVAQRVNKELVTRGRQVARIKLRFRKSGGPKRSLGWIPFKAANLRVKGHRLTFMGKTLRLFQMDRFLDHRQTSGAKLGDGNFAQNALGEWFLNVPVTIQLDPAAPTTWAQRYGRQPVAPRELVGIDPGLKAVVTTSDGEVFEPNRSYRNLEAKIAQAQRHGHKKQAKRRHAKARNQRSNYVHQISRRLIDTYQCLKLGNVSCAFLRSGAHAKSALDGGWGMLKAQLHAKGHRAGRWVHDVNEAYSTQTCSDCGARSGPTGRTGLVVREWTCRACGATHQRDINSAIVIKQSSPAPRCESNPKRSSPRIQREAGRPSAGTR